MQASFLRAFFAIDLSTEEKEQLADYHRMLKKQIEEHYKRKHFRWVRPDNSHITLQFLARVDEKDLPNLVEQVRGEVKKIPAFEMRLGPLEWFPSIYRPHVLSLQTQPHEQLARLSVAIGRGIVKASYPIEDRVFRGHLTLSRIAYLQNVGVDLLNRFDLPVLTPVSVREIVLFRSEPSRGGSTYTALEKIKLKM